MSRPAGLNQLPAGVRVFERGWLSANGILFEGRDSTALVDTGYATHAAQTLALVESALGSRPLDQILNTHLHSDHCGGNAAIQELYPQVKTLIPPGLSQFVQDWDPVALSYSPTGQVCPRFSFNGLLQPAQEMVLADLAWQVHAAPGHDPHSVILFEPHTRTLISADALWENGFGIVFAELEGDAAFGEVERTLDLIESLAPLIVIPGHGAVFTDAGAALKRARSRLHGFVNDPPKHARHAAKVLLKFKLLELQQIAAAALNQWACETQYFRMMHRRFFTATELPAWIDTLITDLVKTGAARTQGQQVFNA